MYDYQDDFFYNWKVPKGITLRELLRELWILVKMWEIPKNVKFNWRHETNNLWILSNWTTNRKVDNENELIWKRQHSKNIQILSINCIQIFIFSILSSLSHLLFILHSYSLAHKGRWCSVEYNCPYVIVMNEWLIFLIESFQR